MPAHPLPADATGDDDTQRAIAREGEKRAHVPREEWRRLHPKPPREKGSGDGDFGAKGGPARARLVGGILRSQAELEVASPRNLQLWGLDSVEAYFETEDRRASAKVSLDALMRDPDISPERKHDASARHHVVWGRSTFACAKCWLLKGNCVCRFLLKASMRPPFVRVICYAHHNEVARGNGTGNLIPACLPFGELLVAGLAEHEKRLECLLRENAGRVAVLWPRGTMEAAEIKESLLSDAACGGIEANEVNEVNDDDATSIETHDESKKKTREERQVGWTLVAVDATWNSARKMVSRIPSSVPRVSVPAEAFQALAARVPPLPTYDSLLGPVRKYDARKNKKREDQPLSTSSSGDAADSGRRCTFEAVLASLLAVGALDEDACASLLRNVKVKVNAVLRQKHMPEAYDLSGERSGGDAEALASAFANATV